MGYNTDKAVSRARSQSRQGRKRTRSEGPAGMDVDGMADGDVDMEPPKKRIHSSKSRCSHILHTFQAEPSAIYFWLLGQVGQSICCAAAWTGATVHQSEDKMMRPMQCAGGFSSRQCCKQASGQCSILHSTQAQLQGTCPIQGESWLVGVGPMIPNPADSTDSVPNLSSSTFQHFVDHTCYCMSFEHYQCPFGRLKIVEGILKLISNRKGLMPCWKPCSRCKSLTGNLLILS